MKNKNYFTCKKEYTTKHYAQAPYALIKNDNYARLSTNAKFLYIFLLDRVQLSLKNHYFDSKGRAYIFFSREEAAKILNCGLNTAGKAFKELVSVDLIEEVQQRGKRANIIFVKMVMEAKKNEENIKKAKEAKKVLAQKRREYLKKLNTAIKVKRQKLQNLEKALLDRKRQLSRKDTLTIAEQDIKKLQSQIDYDYFRVNHTHSLSQVDYIIKCLAEMKTADATKINGCYVPALQLYDLIDSINNYDIVQILSAMKDTCWEEIRNISAYLKSFIYNYTHKRDMDLAAFDEEFLTFNF